MRRLLSRVGWLFGGVEENVNKVQKQVPVWNDEHARAELFNFRAKGENRGPDNQPGPKIESSRALELARCGYYGEILSDFSIISANECTAHLKHWVQSKLLPKEGLAGHINAELLVTPFTREESRGMGSILGMACGDALGAPLEMIPIDKLVYINDIDNHNLYKSNPMRLQVGQWTDDTSMGLCLLDSLLVCGDFDPADAMHRFMLWWHFGYGNAFGSDAHRSNRQSVGIGANVDMALQAFHLTGDAYTAAGTPNTSGNGSAMRMAPVAVFYHGDVERAMRVGYQQSHTTHQGVEAAECCRLIAFIVCNAIHAPPTKTPKQILDELKYFESPCRAVQCLARSEKESKSPSRNWEWKADSWFWGPHVWSRPSAAGAYVMDAVCRALHCLWTTDSLKCAMLKAANSRGDADTIAAICGTIGGALYGVYDIPQNWIKCVQQWDNQGDIAARAYLAHHGVTLTKLSEYGGWDNWLMCHGVLSRCNHQVNELERVFVDGGSVDGSVGMKVSM